MPPRKVPEKLVSTPFATPEKLRAWFAQHGARKTELWIRFYKLASGKPSVTYPQALDEALAVGWIDGVKKRLDDASYVQRFTPRREGSYWSAVNIAKAEALIAAGRMTPAGLAAFDRRELSAAKRYSFENRPQDLPPEAEAAMRANPKAWAFWEAQPPGYRKVATWFLVSAKKEETRTRRLATLIDCSRRGERLPQLVSPGKATRRP